ncbi:M20/M25/M40 family metallo-hydrolase [Phenylobacterium sp.]|uniref:M20/M25/M40 family metallo-hydrolase n=1 Tax=Phenylobacterium sp. TaxID=1871053 RepID=UPI00391A82AF
MSLIRTLAVSAAVLAIAAPAAAKPPPGLHDQALEILTKGISYRTVAGAGQTVAYAEYIKGVLTAAGYKDGEITIEPMNGTAFLIARYPGKDPKKKPIVISGHMDVVEAKAADWTRDPFTPVVENGWIYGRGAVDNKFDVSMVVATLADLRKQGWTPGRDVVLALSGDEETMMATTAVLAERLKDAELVLNSDGGGGGFKDGKPLPYGVQGAEKTYADFHVTFTDPGGHSSRPTDTNPIYRLSRALNRLSDYQFPVMSNDITRAALGAEGKEVGGPVGAALRAFAANPKDEAAIATLSKVPDYNPILRTTCVATMLEGGHAANALPQKAQATVNCRIFPGVSSESVRQTLVEVMAEPTATVTRMDDGSIDSPASPLRADVMAAVKKAVHARYPGLAIVPWQESGASDSMHFRAKGVPSYGVSGLFMEQGQAYAHGLNEKAPVAAIDGSLDHWNSLIRDLAR